MSYVPDSSLLCGLSVDAAECFGKPHIGASYLRDDAKSNRLDEQARCASCGKLAQSSHHEPPLGMGGRNRSFLLRAPMGAHVLKPALIALCGHDNVAGCHGLRHQGKLPIRWRWERDEYAALWWSGELLRQFNPHDPALYELGHWEIGSKQWRG